MTIAAITSFIFNIILLIFIIAKIRQKQRPALPSNLTTKDELRSQVYSEVNQEVSSVKKNLQVQEEKIIHTTSDLSRREGEIEESKKLLAIKHKELEHLQESYKDKLVQVSERESKLEEEYLHKLNQITKLSGEDLEDQFREELKLHVTADLKSWKDKQKKVAEEDAQNVAREVVAMAVQRCSSEVANAHTLTIIELEDNELKGKIIGKNGRNIQWLEKTLGVEIVIDQTPNQIGISGFNSVRRHIAQKTIMLLLEDGRVHPASIEEMYAKAKKEIQEEIMHAGNEAMRELEINDFPRSLIELIGRLKFRTSYGQNMLRHSLEMAKLAKLLAIQMNEEFAYTTHPIDVEICVKGALLHDIGKAMDEETIPKGNHVDLGEKICDRFGLDWRIRKCISSHHNERYEDEEHGFCIEAPLVDACDNISGGRLGARKETAEAYNQRLTKLENIANSIPGVSKSWIMNGNRELWVFFDTKVVRDGEMQQLVHQIAERIEAETNFPTTVKVIGYWEDKVIEYAK